MPALTPFRDYEENDIFNTYDYMQSVPLVETEISRIYDTVPIDGFPQQVNDFIPYNERLLTGSWTIPTNPPSDTVESNRYSWGNGSIQVSGVYTSYITGSYSNRIYDWPTFVTVWDAETNQYVFRKKIIESEEDKKRRAKYVCKWKEVDWNY